MNVALCLYGCHPAEAETLAVLLDALQGISFCDVFFVTWEGTKAESLLRMKALQAVCTANVRLRHVLFNDPYVSDAKVAGLCAKDNKSLNTFENFYARKVACLLSEWIKAKDAIEYDLVICCRAGTCINRPLMLPNYRKYFECGYVILPDNTYNQVYIPFQEEFAFGVPDAMFRYSMAYDFIEVCAPTNDAGEKQYPDPGWIMLRYLNEQRIPFGHGNFRACHLSMPGEKTCF